MKFELNKYWKHTRCLDVFFCVNNEVFDKDEDCLILNGTWCTQGTSGWWFTKIDSIKISQEEYENWIMYRPEGKLIL